MIKGGMNSTMQKIVSYTFLKGNTIVFDPESDFLIDNIPLIEEGGEHGDFEQKKN